MKNTGKSAKAAQVSNMLTGTKLRFPDGSQVLSFDGQTRTVDQVTGAMQTLVDNRDAVETAQAVVAVKIAAEEAQWPALLAIIAGFVRFIRLTFGNAADVLGDLDIPTAKVPAPRTAEEKAISAAKRKATREARGMTTAATKKAKKGNITAKLVVTPNDPPSPAAAATVPAANGGTPPTPNARS